VHRNGSRNSGGRNNGGQNNDPAPLNIVSHFYFHIIPESFFILSHCTSPMTAGAHLICTNNKLLSTDSLSDRHNIHSQHQCLHWHGTGEI